MEKFLKFRLVHKISKTIHTYDTIVFIDFNSNTFVSTDGNEYDLCGFDIDYAGVRVDKNNKDMFVGDIVKIPVLRATHEGQSNKNVWSKHDGFIEGLFKYGIIIHNSATLEINVSVPHWGKNKKIRDDNTDPIGRETTKRTLYAHRALWREMEVITNHHVDPEFFDLEGYMYEDAYARIVKEVNKDE
jgi:hypothetical protein